jgi:predicted RNA binding protein YcfA (HicA-like mRNA interferase family)
VSHKDTRQLIARLREQGFTVRLAKSGHYRVSGPGGQTVTVPQSPSCGRSLANARANLRRWLGAEV